MSLVGATVRMLLAMGVVCGLLWVSARAMRARNGLPAGRGLRLGGGRIRSTARLEVVSRATIGRAAAVAVVRHGDRELVLGVTDAQVTLLSDREAPPEPEPEVAPDGTPVPSAVPGWGAVLDALRAKTVRR